MIDKFKTCYFFQHLKMEALLGLETELPELSDSSSCRDTEAGYTDLGYEADAEVGAEELYAGMRDHVGVGVGVG